MCVCVCVCVCVCMCVCVRACVYGGGSVFLRTSYCIAGKFDGENFGQIYPFQAFGRKSLVNE